MKNKWVIFDLDGTLANIENRLEKSTINGKLNYGKLHESSLIALDEPMTEVIDFLKSFKRFGCKIMILSARFESTIKVTKEWFDKYNIPYDILKLKSMNETYMHSAKWKSKYLMELLTEISSPENVILAVDDFEPNQKMFESYGIHCLNPNTITN